MSAHRRFGDTENFEIEGDGPLGIVFRECAGGNICIRSVEKGTAAAETPDLLDGMVLVGVDGRATQALGYDAAMQMMCVHHSHLFGLAAMPAPPC
jgi:hypothetical protein